MSDLVRTTDRGLYCEAGGFYIDPWRPVDRAVITHAHADHTRAGSRSYLTTPEGRGLVERRVQSDAVVDTLPYGQRLRIGGVDLSFHPAGHVLGSAQVRIEGPSGTWVISGDYKLAPDPTCAPFEPVPCDVFVTESTFGLPVFEWPAEEELIDAICRWWSQNQEDARTSLLCAYSLGKAQRILAGLRGRDLGPIAVHGAVAKLNEAYENVGVTLADHTYADAEVAKAIRGRGLVLAPPSTNGTPWMRKFGTVATGFASGWMRLRGPRRRRNFEQGFVMSDHADWNGLLEAIGSSGAERVLVTHGSVDTLVRYLREERGIDASPLKTDYVGEDGTDADTAVADGEGET